jgi:D-sedoheptulose 7-phosphate isomerase
MSTDPRRAHVVRTLKEAAAAHERMAEDVAAVVTVAGAVAKTLKAGGSVLVFGNGGSAADAQHFAAELLGRFEKERKAYPAIALTTDTSAMTAIGNDYGFDRVFARQLEALGKAGDVAIGISTSGNSPNVLRALEAGNERAEDGPHPGSAHHPAARDLWIG